MNAKKRKMKLQITIYLAIYAVHAHLNVCRVDCSFLLFEKKYEGKKHNNRSDHTSEQITFSLAFAPNKNNTTPTTNKVGFQLIWDHLMSWFHQMVLLMRIRKVQTPNIQPPKPNKQR